MLSVTYLEVGTWWISELLFFDVSAFMLKRKKKKT